MTESDLPLSESSGSSGSSGPPGLPAKGVADILADAVRLYRAHAKALIVTCALLIVPASFIKSCALAMVLGPTAAAVAPAVDLEALSREAAASQRALADAYARHADTDTIARLQRENRELLESATARTLTAAQGAFGSLGLFLLGVLGMAITLFFLYAIIVPITNGALTIAVADRVLGGNAGWREVWMLLFRRLDKLLSALIPAALLVALGLMLFVIPGIVLAFLFAFVSPVVLIEGLGGRAALRRSVELVRSDWLRVALVVVVFAVIQGVARILASALIPHSAIFMDSLITDLVNLVLLPIPIIGAVLLYFDIRRNREGFTNDRLRADLEALKG
jgi:hypothetical protein